MPSSSGGHLRGAPWVAVAAMLVVTGCAPPQSVPDVAAAPALSCTGDVGFAEVEPFRTAVEGGAFYEAALSGGRAESCEVHADDSRLEVRYGFSTGTSLVATIDPTIEYSRQEVTFGSPLADPKLEWLRMAERSMAGPDGCGIGWDEPRMEERRDGPGTDRVFLGSSCSCQLRVHLDARGRMAGLLFQSAC